MNEREQIINDYLAAFRAANPGKEAPVLVYYGNGWYAMQHFGTHKFQKTRLRQMTERLKARAARVVE